MRSTPQLTLALLFLTAPVLSAAQTDFPTDAGLVNVRTVYGAAGDGVTDDTTAIQTAIRDNIGKLRVLYFPSGTYLVSDTLIWKNAAGTWGCYLNLQGQNRTNTIIKLQNSCPGYASAATPKAVIKTGSQNPYTTAEGDGNQAFMNSITNLTVDTGTGNLGAIGIDYMANNQGSIEEVTIKGTGVSGLSMTRKYPGPCLIKNVSITGFTYGVNISRSEYSVVFENLTLSGQLTGGAGVNNTGNVLLLRKVTSTNTVPAIRSSGSTSMITVLDGVFNGGSASFSAIDTAAGELYARNVSSTGYQSVIRSKGVVISGSTKSEFVSNTIERLFPSPDSALNLPVQETPVFHDNNMANWANVMSYGAVPSNSTDDSAAIQAAIDSGATTVYFPSVVSGRYAIANTLIVRGNVRRIIGFNTPLFTLNAGSAFSDAANPKPVFRVSGSNDVVIEGIRTWQGVTGGPGTIWIEHANPKSLTLRHAILGAGCKQPYVNTAGAGRFFIEDVCSGPWRFDYAQDIFARQLNPENSGLKVQNTGARVWLLGLKTEVPGTVIETRSGGSTELLGGLLYPVSAVPTNQPAFISTESAQSLIYAVTAYGSTANNYNIQVQETRAGVTDTLLRTDIPTRGYGSSMPLYSGGYLAGGLPAPWQSQDIGAVGLAGNASYSGGTFSVAGAGADIWYTADKFRYVYQTASGDCQITARVTSQTNTAAWAKSGVMIRESLAADSANMFMLISPGNGTTSQRRVTTAGSTVNTTPAAGTTPCWVRVVRSGSTFTSYRSTDGTNWTQVGSYSITMGSNIYIGLAVSSHTSSALCTTTFDNVTAAP